MLKHFAAALFCTVLATPAWAQSIKKMDAGLDAVIAPGTKIEKVATGFIFSEGPMWKDGKVWFSDVRGNKVRTYDPKTNKVTVVLNDSGGLKNAPPDKNFGSNGMITDKDGSILLTRMYMGAIELMDDKGTTKPFLSKYQANGSTAPTTWPSPRTALCGSPIPPSACRKWTRTPRRRSSSTASIATRTE